MFELHISDALSFRKCRRRWWLGSKTQQNLEPIIPDTKLWLGTGVHLGLEAHSGSIRRNLSHDDAVQNMVGSFEDWSNEEIARIHRESLGSSVEDAEGAGLDPEQVEKLEDGQRLGIGMLLNYGDWVKKFDEEHGVKYLSEEVKFKLPLTEDTVYAGRFDGMVEFEGHLYIHEIKTTISIETPYLLLDEQAGAYVLAAREMEHDVEGILYTFLRKKLPTVPRTLVAGGVSKVKNLDTTFDIYLEAILDAKENPKDYMEVLHYYKQNAKPFFKRVPIYRSVRETNELKQRLIYIVEDMREAVEKKRLYPTAGRMECRMCGFVPICLAIAEGADSEYILRTRYQTRPEKRPSIEWNDEGEE